MLIVPAFYKFKTFKVVKDNMDITYVPLDTFVRWAGEGKPQFLEAMWSPIPHIDRIPALRSSFRPDTGKVIRTYRKIIKSHWEEGVEEDNLKKRRHAVRLSLNLATFEKTGRFNPTLTEGEKYLCDLWAGYRDLTAFEAWV
jgi:hypothetical protein